MKTPSFKLLVLGSVLVLSGAARAAETPQAFGVKITEPVGGASFLAGTSVKVAATVSSNANPIVRMDFYDILHNVLLGSSTAAPFSITWKPTVAGTYYLRATGVDAIGQTANSAVVYPLNVTSSTTTGVTGGGGTTSGGGTTVTTYSVTVVSGTGGGSYAPGVTVTLTANAPPTGQWFNQWSVSGGVVLANPAATTITFTMPATNVSAAATYKGIPPTMPSNPILFVTQIPIGFDYLTIGSVFGNHQPSSAQAGRGGDLYIRYPDGSLRNLTAEAGYGVPSGYQGANGIAVREPSVHWSGQKAVFSMVVGMPATQAAVRTNVWQLYEITGFGVGQPVAITKVPNQPTNYNNVSPCYGTDGRIIFASDRPRNGQAHLYPQLDEYEAAPCVSGLWSLNPANGDLFNLNHTPSGVFSPSIDSFGRLVFVRWDHLQRDQEADLDMTAAQQGQSLPYGAFNYTDETATAGVLAGNIAEVYPEPRTPAGNVNGHTFNVFFPWMINEDGTEEETMNHVGRHEIAGYLTPSFTDDRNLGYFYNPAARYNKTYINNFLHLREDPLVPGRYFGTDAPEFFTHSAGQIVALNAPQGRDADHITTDYVTDPIAKQPTSTPPPNHSGVYREPLPLSDGTLVAVHSDRTDVETKRVVPSDFQFRLKTLWRPSTYWQSYQALTPGINKSVTYPSSAGLVSYSGPLWELNPVEVRARAIPHGSKTPLGQPEQQVFAEEGVNLAAFQASLKASGLALVVSRNVTTRDHADRQQPFNLHVAGSAAQTLGAGGKIYDVSHLQFFQADQIRGYGMRTATSVPAAGRRVLAQPLHDSAAVTSNPPNNTGPAGSVALGLDGSMAAIFPARRALTWQLTDPAGAAVVRERYWLTFQPGEIRTCTSCHGVNTIDQANRPAPTNKPEALRSLLQYWKSH